MESQELLLLSTDELIQPECLSEQIIRSLLVQKGMLSKDLPSDRGGLLNLYNRLVLPLPQRTYKESRFYKNVISKTCSLTKIQNGGDSEAGTSSQLTQLSKPINSQQVQMSQNEQRNNSKNRHEAPPSGPDAKKSRSVITYP